ncbi:hypothetical protein C1637_24960 [Chryseobacterium lactis]|uniref:DUF4280 domain-containing protein n=1 Tax=Chryseobacterium lactis TaxID=1241981 RepID=A0A3G6RD50_CHRLC|nr:hypothetical protein [Chryseobacterium lactis]AZA82591.1 hypothetical protein EG342_12105 [Chryseobacterium lactis]AZB02972.1 hypothetical protein EG341_02965 [Chryseobacterium lactis]PNW10960.1 hypothetical protein C1637_24960 [Chryseobacterium lactis]
MSKYLPQETFIVCSHQVNTSPGNILANPDLWNLSVVYKSEKKPLLTEADLLLKDDFECKSNWGQAVGWGFFWGGLITGLAIGLAVAFSVLTFGVGAIIIGVVATAVIGAGLTFALKSNATKCNPNLVEWKNPHPSVAFEGNKAVNLSSFMTCSVGPGILTPFIDEEEAKSAAKNVAFRNMGELGLTAVISGLFGFGVGLAAGSTGGLGSGLLAGGAEVGVGFVGAYLVYQPLAYLEGEGMQYLYSSDDGSTPYDKMLESRQEMSSPFTVDTPDDPYIGTAQTGASEKLLYHSYDKYRQNQNEKYIKEIMNLKGTRAEREARTAEIVAEMKKTRSGAQAVEAMKRKGSGKILPRVKTSNKGNKVINEHRAETNKGMKSEASKGFGGMAAVGLVLPLLVTPLSEWTFKVLADSYANQSGGGFTIAAKQN